MGTKTTKSTWTYTVKSTDGATFARAVPVYSGVINGESTFAAADSIGWAFYEGDTLKLLWVAGGFDTAGRT